MRFGRWLLTAAVVAVIGLGVGHRARRVLSPTPSCGSSHFPGSSPQVRIRSILTEPFRGPDERHCVIFLDDHENMIREIGAEGVPCLVRGLQDDDPDVRLRAVLSLSVLGADAAPAVSALRPLLESRKDRQAYWTIICLGEIGKASRAAVPDLLALPEHPRGCPFPEQIGEAIARIAIESGELPEELSESLTHENPGVRHAALLALGECGFLAEPLLPQIMASLRDPQLLVRTHAVLCLGKIGRRPELTIPALLKALDDPRPSVRCAAATAIGDFGPEAADAIPHLTELLEYPISRLRADAATALGNIGPKAGQAVPALTVLLTDTYPSVRLAAAEALRKIGPAAQGALPASTKAPGYQHRKDSLDTRRDFGKVRRVSFSLRAFASLRFILSADRPGILWTG